MFGDNSTLSAGGRALEYYLFVDIVTKSSKTKDKILDENDNPIGINISLEVKKNKCAIPFRSSNATLYFNKGLDEFSGLLDSFIQNKVGLIAKEKARYEYNGCKFTESTFVENLTNKDNKEMGTLRQLIGL
jgi:hypothetical protein